MGMYDDQGKIKLDRFQNAHHLTKGLNQAISTQIAPGVTIDATNAIAYWLGFSKGMNYVGLEREDGSPQSFPPLSNCFASTFALMEQYDLMGYHLASRGVEEGTNVLFDLLVLDPTLILSNTVVAYEMCELDTILEQSKQMAGADWASVADNASRQLLVIGYESPEARKEIKKLKSAADCAKGVYDDYEAEKDAEEAADREAAENGNWTEEDGSSGDWNFQADPAKSGKDAAACFGDVDRFTVGDISGHLFAHFWNNEINPEE